MKRILLIIAAAVSLASCAALNQERLMQSGAKVMQAFSISDNDIKGYVTQSVAQLDAKNQIVTSGNYVTRLNKITKGLTQVDGTPLTFKVYKNNEVNAFACADGNVRVYTGLLDVMTDDEALGVIGHEVGHVALQHTLNAYKMSLFSSAAMDVIASTGNLAAALTDSVLGQLATQMIDAKFSRKQETEADDFGYGFLVGQKKNPYYMAMAFEKLMEKSQSGTPAQISSIANLFSSHPDTQSRIDRVNKRASAEGYTRPAK
jgi:putative metalloprotease